MSFVLRISSALWLTGAAFAQSSAPVTLTMEPGYQIFECACHEGNYAMRNRLSAARAEEAKEIAEKK